MFVHRELVEELHPLMKEALERRPEVILTTVKLKTLHCLFNVGFTFCLEVHNAVMFSNDQSKFNLTIDDNRLFEKCYLNWLQ